jgi:hypothetical protein
LNNFLDSRFDEDNRKKQASFGDPAYRAPNQHFVIGYEHALRAGLGLRMVDFVVENPPKPLTAIQERYYVPVDELEGWVPPYPDEPERWKSCIDDKSNGSRWIEVPVELTVDGRPSQKSLHTCIDLASTNAPGGHWLYAEAHVRGSLFDDSFHSEHNVLKNAANDAGVYPILAERSLIQNAASGPHKGAAFYQKIVQHGRRYVQCRNEDCAAFGMVFDRICSKLQSFPPDYGSKRHRKEVWQTVKASPSFDRKPQTSRIGRWYDVFAAEAADEKKDPATPEHRLLFQLSLGVQAGYWPNLEKSPMGSMFASIVPIVPTVPIVPIVPTVPKDPIASSTASSSSVAPPIAVPDESNVAKRVALSNSDLEDLKKKGKNMLDVSTRALANDFHDRIFQGLRVVVKPFQEAFGRSETMIKTSGGCFELHTERALGHKVVETSYAALSMFNGGRLPPVLRFMDVDTPSPCKSELDDEMDVGYKLLDFGVKFVGRNLLQSMKFSHSVPGIFVLLCHTKKDVVDETLDWLRQLFATLCESELAALSDDYVKRKLHYLVNLKWPWVRQCLIILSEFNFQHAAKEVTVDVRRLFSSPISTLMNELALNELDAVVEVSRKKDICRVARWRTLVVSTLALSFDCRPAPRTVSSQSVAQKRTIPRCLFDNDVEDFSLGMDKLTEISNSNDWCSPSAQSWHLIPTIITQMILEAGNWVNIKMDWYSNLLEPTSLLFVKDRGVFLVLYASSFGMVVWQVDVTRDNGLECIRLRDPKVFGKGVWSWMAIDSSVGKKAVRLTTLPCTAQAALPLTDRAAGVLVGFEGAPQDLEVFAAERAFHNLTVTQLRDLLRINLPAEELLKEQPKTEKKLVIKLMTMFLPGKTDAELEALYKARETRRGDDKVTTSITEEFLDSCGPDFVDASEMDELKAAIKRRTPKERKTAPNDVDDDAVPAEPKAKKKQPRKALPHKTDIDLKWARRFIPKTKGCTLTMDTIRHYRWCIEYTQKPMRPRHNSKVFGDESALSKINALKSVLRWAWEVHTDLTDEECPWHLDGLETALAAFDAESVEGF